MNDMTPTSDGGGGGSSSNAGVGGVGKAIEAARLYVDADELDAFAEVALEHEQLLNQLVEFFALQRPMMMPSMSAIPVPKLGTFDAENLQLGSFDEALDCSEAFREVTYKGTVTATNHVGAGQHVCGTVAKRTRENYLDTDGGIAIDTQSLDREIENAGQRGPSVMDTDSDWSGSELCALQRIETSTFRSMRNMTLNKCVRCYLQMLFLRRSLWRLFRGSLCVKRLKTQTTVCR